MNTPYHIRYLKRKEIDLQKWEDCIDRSPNGLVYASFLYLDDMALHWDALVFGDYEAVMPMTWNSKWGIRYLYQPPLSPQLGIFSPAPISKDLIRAFLEKAIAHFKFAEIFLNFSNAYPGLRPFTNIVLDLTPPYETLRKNYRKDLEKNLRKAAGFPMQYKTFADVHGAIDLYRKYYEAKTPHVKEADYRNFTAFCRRSQKMDFLILRAAYKCDPSGKTDRQNDSSPLALALLLKKNKRLILLMSVCPPTGRKIEANHFLLDRLIHEFAGTQNILDFDGSEIPGVAHFYGNFGGDDQPFFFYRHNRLPWPLRLLKNTGNP